MTGEFFFLSWKKAGFSKRFLFQGYPPSIGPFYLLMVIYKGPFFEYPGVRAQKRPLYSLVPDLNVFVGGVPPPHLRFATIVRRPISHFLLFFLSPSLRSSPCPPPSRTARCAIHLIHGLRPVPTGIDTPPPPPFVFVWSLRSFASIAVGSLFEGYRNCEFEFG